MNCCFHTELTRYLAGNKTEKAQLCCYCGTYRVLTGRPEGALVHHGPFAPMFTRYRIPQPGPCAKRDEITGSVPCPTCELAVGLDSDGRILPHENESIMQARPACASSGERLRVSVTHQQKEIESLFDSEDLRAGYAD